MIKFDFIIRNVSPAYPTDLAISPYYLKHDSLWNGSSNPPHLTRFGEGLCDIEHGANMSENTAPQYFCIDEIIQLPRSWAEIDDVLHYLTNGLLRLQSACANKIKPFLVLLLDQSDVVLLARVREQFNKGTIGAVFQFPAGLADHRGESRLLF